MQDIVVSNSATYVVSGSPVQTPSLPPQSSFDGTYSGSVAPEGPGNSLPVTITIQGDTVSGALESGGQGSIQMKGTVYQDGTVKGSLTGWVLYVEPSGEISYKIPADGGFQGKLEGGTLLIALFVTVCPQGTAYTESFTVGGSLPKIR
jgi:hypothetical protein